MKAGGKIWRTADGQHVADGHPDAAMLAYAASDDCPEHIVHAAYPPPAEPEPAEEPVKQAEEKAAKQAPNKKAKPGANKATGEGE